MPKPRPTYVTEFEVEGTGTFPYDMLRYDQCAPVDSMGAVNIGPSMTELRKVKLCRYGRLRNGPTVARWNSFGWRVVL